MVAALKIADLSPMMQLALRRPAAARLELERLDYEQSLIAFTRDAWKYVEPKPFVGGWHLEAIAEHLQAVTRGQIRNLLINIPPRLTKSLLVSVVWPAWVWAQRRHAPLSGPQVQFLTTSYAQQLSVRDSVRCRRLVSSPWYQRLWGHRFQPSGDQNAKQRFDNSAGGYRLATSVRSQLTGEGGDVIVFDDPHNTVEIESEAIIASTTMWWDEALSTRHNDPETGAFVGVMQRLSEVDISGHILNTEPENWVHLCLPMEYESRRHCTTSLPWSDPRTIEGELLAPDRYSAASLAKLKRKLGPYGTAGQLQQAPVPRGGGILKRDWWQLWPPEGESKDNQGRALKKLMYPEMQLIIGSVDTAMTEDEENDFSAMTIWGVWYNQFDMPMVMLMEAWEERLQFHELVAKIIVTAGKRKMDRLLIEGKNNGFSVVQEVQRLCIGAGFTVHAEKVVGDKVARAHSVVPLFAAGQVWAPDRVWADRVITNCASFPKAEHDDTVDTVTQALSWMRKNAILQMKDERAEELRKRLAPIGEKRQKLPYDV